MTRRGSLRDLFSLVLLCAAAACSHGRVTTTGPDGGEDGGAPCPGGCPTGEICDDGVCRTPDELCEGVTCPPGRVCLLGSCVPQTDPCIGVVCDDAALVCQGGECVPIDSDEDEDGYPAAEDCDDRDAEVNPGATEVCNGIDDDCDEDIDELFDGDGDGFTTCGGGAPAEADCDDEDDAVFPGAEEGCNGADDDCDEQVDEEIDDRPCTTACGTGTETCEGGDWSCSVPATCECYPAGRTETLACGLCDTGTQTRTCRVDLTWGPPTACVGGGECEPGSVQDGDCDRCAEQVCGDDCTWSECVLRDGAECEWQEGTHYRCCGDGMWQYCLGSCVWSTDCAPCSGCC